MFVPGCTDVHPREANVQGEARKIVIGCFGKLQEWMPYTFTTYEEMTGH